MHTRHGLSTVGAVPGCPESARNAQPLSTASPPCRGNGVSSSIGHNEISNDDVGKDDNDDDNAGGDDDDDAAAGGDDGFFSGNTSLLL